MQDLNLFALYTEKLIVNDIDFFITGSVASIIYGDPRLTHDIDLVLSMSQFKIDNFIKAFPIAEFYCPPSDVIKAEIIRPKNGHFNLIHHETGFKADIYFIGNDEFQIWAMNNRKEIIFLDKKLFIAPPEYVIIKKMEFYREGKSQKHLYDIAAMLKNSKNLIDLDFILERLSKLELLDLWEEIRLL
ncbi:MAG: hypothetical protein CVV24_11640 [Ignavibacteriae bacterium HGW-Ignavibacteriae-3]|nr:MAG: hypothetical protein CVV24_11640 [Ignavibacteriae bacterium HGW-Ignavibacteriae-3]